MNSTTQSVQSGDTLGNHALQLALQTMNERCQQLQQRLTMVEDENIKLRVKYSSEKYLRSDSCPQKTDVEQLQEKIAEITRQKSQLMHHICMVATENRHLWSRLSKLTKDNHSLGSQLTKINDVLTQHTNSPKLVSSNIIRSKTFTQNTPNLKLLPKIDSNESDISLEEISLKLINSFMQGKTELEEQYEQMVELQSDADVGPCLDIGTIGFAYMSENEDELLPTISQCIEQFDQMREEMLKQKNHLNSILKNVEYNKNVKVDCLKCSSINNKISTSTNTEEDMVINYLTKWGTPVATTSNTDKSIKSQSPTKEECPMCGKILFTTLNEFRIHVEQHFSNEDNDDVVIDGNYEIVTRVGDF